MVNHTRNTRNTRRKHNKRRMAQRLNRKQSGGFGPGAGPVGQAWTHDPNTWPGVAALGGANTQGIVSSNHYPLSPHGVPVGGVMMAEPEVGLQSGGKSRRLRRRKCGKRHTRTKRHSKRRHTRTKRHIKRRHLRVRKMRGGFGPQDIVNMVRGVGHNMSNVYNNFMGHEHSPNPSPLDQPINSNDFPESIVSTQPVNLRRSFDLAGRAVAPM